MAKQPSCVDVQARRRMAVLMRGFAAHRLTIGEFEDACDLIKSSDEAVHEAYIFAWSHYDDFCDFETTKLGTFTPEGRRLWATWVLYLMTDRKPYAWGSSISLWGMLIWLAILTACGLGLARVNPFLGLIPLALVLSNRLWWPTVERLIDLLPKRRLVPEHWPFASSDSFVMARSENPFATTR